MRAETGTWEGQIRGVTSYNYTHKVTYTCGPYGSFKREDGSHYTELVSTCGWFREWEPPQIDECEPVACPQIPIPPPTTGLLHLQDEQNKIQLESGIIDHPYR